MIWLKDLVRILRSQRMDKTADRLTKSSRGPELFIALVGAVGTDLKSVSEALTRSLSAHNYSSEVIRLSKLLDQFDCWNLRKAPEESRYEDYMNAGTKLRSKVGRGDVLALLAVARIRRIRRKSEGKPYEAKPRCAYILRQLKHPDEVNALRELYGASFFLVAAYSPREQRVSHLSRRIAESHHVFQSSQFLDEAEKLIKRDEFEAEEEFGQKVRLTFPMADVFLNTSDPDLLQRSANRFVELIFGNTFHTPERDEYGMFHAQAAALRSSSLGRQVGAVISTEEGNIISVGTNEVPKYGGGLYWCEDSPDHRDFRLGYDTSDRMRRNLLADVLKRLQDGKWLRENFEMEDTLSLVDKALNDNDSPLMKSAHFMNLLEFGRAVHAEMAAIVDAARRGVSVAGCTLYATTFPCHECARHIVAAGIERVVYIEPYPKSLVPELYPDSISVDGEEPTQLCFDPFVGIAPRQYMRLFSMRERKGSGGDIITYNPLTSEPRYSASEFYLSIEEDQCKIIIEKIEEVMEGAIFKANSEGEVRP